MSDCAINIRIMFWHWQVTFKNKWSFSVNRYRLEDGKLKSILFPFAVYDFRPWEIK